MSLKVPSLALLQRENLPPELSPGLLLLGHGGLEPVCACVCLCVCLCVLCVHVRCGEWWSCGRDEVACGVVRREESVLGVGLEEPRVGPVLFLHTTTTVTTVTEIGGSQGRRV